MSIAGAFDRFKHFVAGSLDADHKELHDNVVIENNDFKTLKKGFCFEFGGESIGENNEISCNTYTVQDASVVLTVANFGTIRDIDKRQDAEKKLLTWRDAVKAVIAFHPQLEDAVGEATVARCTYEGSDPMELVLIENETDPKEFMMIRLNFTIGYYVQDNSSPIT